MVFQGGFMVFHGFWLLSMVFHGFGWFPWFFKVVSWSFMVFGWCPWFFQGGFMISQGLWLVSMVLLVENTTKLYPGPTIQSRPCRPQAGFGLVTTKSSKKK